MENRLNYEPTLWLIPYKYGLRLRDGKWIRNDGTKSNNYIQYIDYANDKVITICRSSIAGFVQVVTDIADLEGQIIFDAVQQKTFVISNNKIVEIYG